MATLRKYPAPPGGVRLDLLQELERLVAFEHRDAVTFALAGGSGDGSGEVTITSGPIAGGVRFVLDGPSEVIAIDVPRQPGQAPAAGQPADLDALVSWVYEFPSEQIAVWSSEKEVEERPKPPEAPPTAGGAPEDDWKLPPEPPSNQPKPPPTVAGKIKPDQHLKELLDAYPPKNLRTANRVAASIERLFNRFDVGAGFVESPRIDGERLVTELVTRRMQIGRARRWELEPPTKLFLLDDSPSCGGLLAHSVGLVPSFLRRPDVLVITHFNGFPSGLYQGSSRRPLKFLIPPKSGLVGVAAGNRQLFTWWEHLIKLVNPAGCIAWGDGDARAVYFQLAEALPTVWLNFRVHAALPGDPSGANATRFSAHGVHVGGINTVDEVLNALKDPLVLAVG